jgi:hypothetical protein
MGWMEEAVPLTVAKKEKETERGQGQNKSFTVMPQ